MVTLISDEFYLGSVILALVIGALVAILSRYLTVTRPNQRIAEQMTRHHNIRQKLIRDSAEKAGLDPAEIEGYDPDWVEPLYPPNGAPWEDGGWQH